MAEFIDLSGFKYGMLRTIQLHCGGHGLHLQWECVCDCGNRCIVSGHKLTTGHTRSCGCLKSKPRFLDLIGMTFNLLTVVSFHSKNRFNKVRWNCVCECGKTSVVQSNNLKTGGVKSCGCLMDGRYSIKHGLKGTRLYAIWDNMKGRCYRPSMKCFKSYGEKGIIICAEWLNDCNKFFEWAMSNGYTEELTIERINVKGNYEPSNCKWIPAEEQARNRTVSIGVEKVIEIKKRLANKETCKSIAEDYGVDRSTIGNIKRGKAYSYVII